MAEIETGRLLLCRWREGDLDAYARICADPEVMRHMAFGTVTREQAAGQVARLARCWEERGYGHWAVEEKATGAFVGRIGLHCHDDWLEGEHKTEVGWLLERSCWGRGLATEGAQASLCYGFEELGLECITLPENVASRRVMERTGLTLRGETRWRGFDVVWYAIDHRENCQELKC